MRISPEQIEAICALLRKWDHDISEETEEDLIGEFDVVEGGGGLEDDPTRNEMGGVRGGDPDTSKKAAKIVYPRTGSQRHLALMAVAICGNSGAIADDVSRLTKIPWRSITPRLGELKRAGWITPDGRTRVGEMGAQQEVIVLTEKAKEWIKKKEGVGFV